MPRYTSVQQVKLYRGIAASETDDDGLIADLIDRAEHQIDTYCGRTFRAPTTAATHYYDAVRDTSDDRKTLYLDSDLAQVNTIVNAGVTLATTHYTPVPRNATPYYAIRLTSLAAGGWTYNTTQEDAITVTGRWGYQTTAPADIRHAAVRLTAYMYAQKDAQVFDVTMFEGGAMTIPQGLPADVKVLLEPYRRLR